MNINLTPVFECIIALLAALVTHRIIPWIKSKTTAAQYERLKSVARVGAFAMEQLYGAGHGDEKFRGLCNYLSEKGFDIDATVIEGTVYEAFNYTSPLLVEPEETQEETPEEGNAQDEV